METLQRTANRGSISTGFDIDNSCKFEADNSESMARTNSSEGDKQKCTLSVWVKRTELSDGFFFTAGDTVNPWFILGFYQNQFYWSTTAGTSASGVMQTNRVFRDTSAWYHIVLAIDTTQGTDTNRYKLYVNGVQETSFGTANYPSQNANLQIMDDLPQDVGGYTSYFYCGYIAEFVAIDGSQLAPTSFGEFDDDTGIWIPKDVSGLTFGTNGFYLDFKDASNLGNDASGGLDFTQTNITSADQSTDTPTNNFCTLNQLALVSDASTYGNITQGATKATATGFDTFITYAPTFGVTSGKWYAEFEYEGSQADNLVGILDIDAVVAYNSRLGKVGQWSVGFYQANGKLYVTSDSGTTETANWGASAANGDIISVAVDMDNHFVYFAKNGTWQNSGVPTSGSTGTGGVAFDSNKTVGIGCSSYDQGGDEGQIYANYGGYTAGTISSAASDSNNYGTFEYAPPSGYYALCTKNLAEYG